MRSRVPTNALSSRHLGPVLVAAAVLCGTLLTGCEAGPSDDPQPGPGGTSARSAGETSSATPVRLVTNLASTTDVPVDTVLSVGVEGGSLEEVTVTYDDTTLPGSVKADRWQAGDRLEPGTDYEVVATAARPDGHDVTRRTQFRTQDLTLDQQTFASVAPLSGETVGVGMPVVVTFDLPVHNKATFEKHMSVTSTPAQPGSWRWLSATEAHWRPKTYWKPGTTVEVDLDINALPAGNGIYGQKARDVEFSVGDSVVSKVDAANHRMRTFVNGRLARTMAISAGKAGWETRSGTKVIIEKFRRKRMDASTIGVSENDPEYYNLANVEYALRMTYSGEFIHAAPWSVGSQGSANVSHGCVGMATEDARWLYEHTSRGDIVEVSGTDRQMTLTNGYGDWTMPYARWRKGSALS